MIPVSFDINDVKPEYRRPSPGAYVCKITKVLYTELDPTTNKGNHLKIWYDIDQGEFKGYYSEMRERFGTKDDVNDWVGRHFVSCKESAKGMFSRFCNAVNESNANFVFDGKTHCDEQTLVGKRIGLVFREEEYNSNMGEVRIKLSVAWECPVSEVKDQPIPKTKRLPETPTISNSSDLFVPAGDDEELPFA